MRKVLAVLGAVAIAIAGSAHAQGDPAAGSDTAGATPPGGIPVGPLTVYPSAGLAHGYDDNLFLRPSNRATSSYTLFTPSVRAEMKTGPHKFDFGLRIIDARYHSSPADSYTDTTFF